MKFYGQAAAVAAKIVEAFQTGCVPAPLAQLYLRRQDGKPMRSWSILNQLSVLLAGCSDARGFRQWEAAGRWVKKGEKAYAWILVPLQAKVEADDGEASESAALITYGYKSAAVFDISQTEGEPIADTPNRAWLDILPLVEVAHAFGLEVTGYAGRPGRALGHYAPGRHIALGVENLATWAHELVHAADDRLGNLQQRGGHWLSETVAELGGATLLVLLGKEVEADTGGAWAYIQQYAEAAGIQPAAACFQALNRLAQAIDLILETAESCREGSNVQQSDG
ncbi:MAG: ssDNA-binding domain-containing protein [Chloroflexi bacterium]|nr:ssDNA-binding domain-containing protein [Chloroflexota bacterium]